EVAVAERLAADHPAGARPAQLDAVVEGGDLAAADEGAARAVEDDADARGARLAVAAGAADRVAPAVELRTLAQHEPDAGAGTEVLVEAGGAGERVAALAGLRVAAVGGGRSVRRPGTGEENENRQHERTHAGAVATRDR